MAICYDTALYLDNSGLHNRCQYLKVMIPQPREFQTCLRPGARSRINSVKYAYFTYVTLRCAYAACLYPDKVIHLTPIVMPKCFKGASVRTPVRVKSSKKSYFVTTLYHVQTQVKTSANTVFPRCPVIGHYRNKSADCSILNAALASPFIAISASVLRLGMVVFKYARIRLSFSC